MQEFGNIPPPNQQRGLVQFCATFQQCTCTPAERVHPSLKQNQNRQVAQKTLNRKRMGPKTWKTQCQRDMGMAP